MINTSGIHSKIHSIEVQLRILQSKVKKTKKKSNANLKALKGVLRGKGSFSEKELKEVEIKVSESA